MRAPAVIAILATAVVAAGCGRDPQRGAGTDTPVAAGIGAYPGFDDLDEEGVARRYVEALNRRDGKGYCRAVAPWISGRYDLITKDPDGDLAHLGGGCPRMARVFIGFVGDTGTERFIRANIESTSVSESGELARVELEGTLVIERVHENDRRVRRPLRDVVWMVRDRGSWRVAKPSKVAAAAALGVPDQGSEVDPLSRPDVAAERRAYRAELSSYRAAMRKRDADFRPVGKAADCSGKVVVEDPEADRRDYAHPAPKTPLPPMSHVDLSEVQVRRDGGRICVKFTMWGDVKGPLLAKFNFRDSPGNQRFIQIFDIELRADGAARVTSGKDDDDRSLPVPAAVGVDGRHLTLVIDDKSFEAGEPIPATLPGAQRPTGNFVFMASAEANAGGRRVVNDNLGPQPSPEQFGYPSGRKCELAAGRRC